MKKHISVFGLFARSSACSVLVILILLCAFEILSFHIQLQDALDTYGATGEMPPLERMFSYASTDVLFKGALVLVTLVLCLPGCSFKSRTGYTLCRLSVSERATFFHQAVYNVLIYLVLMATQLTVAYGLARYYIAMAPAECISNQTLVLAFYRSEFLHSLLPLEDVGLWVRNGLLLLSLGLAAAEFPYRQRRHKFSAVIVGLVLYTIGCFNRSIGSHGNTVLTVAIALTVLGAVIHTLVSKDEEVEENE